MKDYTIRDNLSEADNKKLKGLKMARLNLFLAAAILPLVGFYLYNDFKDNDSQTGQIILIAFCFVSVIDIILANFIFGKQIKKLQEKLVDNNS